MASLEKQKIKRVYVPAGRLAESKAESRDCSWASGSKVLKAPGGGSHRLRVSPGPWLRSLTSLGLSPWFWHAQPHPGHPFGAAAPRNQCMLYFSLLLIPGPVSGPSWALAGGLNRKKRNDTRFREGLWVLCSEAHLRLEGSPSPPGWMYMRIALARRLLSPCRFCKEHRLVTGHPALRSLQKRRKETGQNAKRCARCPLHTGCAESPGQRRVWSARPGTESGREYTAAFQRGRLHCVRAARKPRGSLGRPRSRAQWPPASAQLPNSGTLAKGRRAGSSGEVGRTIAARGGEE